MIEDADIRSQSAHVFTEAADSEIMEVLVRHFGEQTSMGISIDARLGVVCLSRCLVSMLVSFEAYEAVELLRAMESVVMDQRKIALDELKRSGRA